MRYGMEAVGSTAAGSKEIRSKEISAPRPAWGATMLFLVCLLTSLCPVSGLAAPSVAGSKRPPARVASEQAVALQVGEVRVLAIPGVARVAVGDGHVMHAVATDEGEVILFARNEGASALQVWTHDGRRLQYQVHIAPEGTRKAHQELRSLLARIPAARVTETGDKLVVEGDDLTDEDRARIADLAGRYPQLLDLTGHVGWNSMVLLDVQVVEVPRMHLRELGLRWSSPAAGGVHGGAVWDAGSASILARPGEMLIDTPLRMGATAGYLGANALLSARLHALEQQGEAVVLAQPQLLARSGATAEFLAGGEVPYAVADGDGNTRTTFKPYGVALRITPHADRSGIVRARIEVEVSSVDAGMSLPGGPSLRTRRASTEFNARSGETLVLAGFLSRESSAQRDGLPTLSRIPVLGTLFGLDRRQRSDTELAIFVTPVLVTPDHPGVQTRLQNSRQILQQAFPGPSRLNTPIQASIPAPGAAAGFMGSDATGSSHSGSVATTASGLILPAPIDPANAPRWNPWSAAGSQWQADASAEPGASARTGSNEYAFTE